MTGDHRSVFWHGVDPFSAELFQLARGNRGWNMHGVVLIGLPEGGTEAQYWLQLDELWRSHRLQVEMSGAHTTALDLVGDGRGSWSVGGRRAPELDGCVDLDLSITPSTNTLPIRRLDPPVGGIVATRVAWVRFPELEVQPDEQTYERLGDRRWMFRSDDFVAELEVDADGLVVRYSDLWTRIVGTGD
jgi:hypothetical protein